MSTSPANMPRIRERDLREHGQLGGGRIVSVDDDDLVAAEMREALDPRKWLALLVDEVSIAHESLGA